MQSGEKLIDYVYSKKWLQLKFSESFSTDIFQIKFLLIQFQYKGTIKIIKLFVLCFHSSIEQVYHHFQLKNV